MTAKLLDRADKIIRRTAKKILHIPSQTANALLYAKERDGGLGLFCFSSRIPDILLGRLDRLSTRADPQLLAILNSDYVTSLRLRLGKLLQSFGRGNEQPSFWRTKLQNAVSGAGLPEHSRNGAVHLWLRDPPPHWSGADFVHAVQLRTNTLPTTGGLHNARVPANLKRCRGGCERIETLSHVLQRCPVTHHQRIRRHDHAVSQLAKSCTAKGHTVQVEPCVRGTDGSLNKPDLVVRTNDNSTFVIDVSVSWETPRPLQDHFDNKVAIYSHQPFLESLRRLYPDDRISISAVILGARGTWCNSNDQVLGQLQLPRGLSRALVSGVLLGGVMIHKAFSMNVWDRNDRRPPAAPRPPDRRQRGPPPRAGPRPPRLLLPEQRPPPVIDLT